MIGQSLPGISSGCLSIAWLLFVHSVNTHGFVSVSPVKQILTPFPR